MRTTRFITVTALFTALLICVQLLLSGVGGVELVTVFFLAFCFCAGIKAGVTVAVCFSTIRCLLFGFYPTVILLYLIYYSLFALFFGFLGKKFGKTASLQALAAVTVTSTLFTAFFTLLDDVLTPFFYGFGQKATLGYFYASLPFMLNQCVCTVISVSLLFIPLARVFKLTVSQNGK